MAQKLSRMGIANTLIVNVRESLSHKKLKQNWWQPWKKTMQTFSVLLSRKLYQSIHEINGFKHDLKNVRFVPQEYIYINLETYAYTF